MIRFLCLVFLSVAYAINTQPVNNLVADGVTYYYRTLQPLDVVTFNIAVKWDSGKEQFLSLLYKNEGSNTTFRFINPDGFEAPMPYMGLTKSDIGNTNNVQFNISGSDATGNAAAFSISAKVQDIVDIRSQPTTAGFLNREAPWNVFSLSLSSVDNPSPSGEFPFLLRIKNIGNRTTRCGAASSALRIAKGKIPTDMEPIDPSSVYGQWDYNYEDSDENTVTIPIRNSGDYGTYYITVGWAQYWDEVQKQEGFDSYYNLTVLCSSPLVVNLGQQINSSVTYHNIHPYKITIPKGASASDYPRFVMVHLQHNAHSMLWSRSGIPMYSPPTFETSNTQVNSDCASSIRTPSQLNHPLPYHTYESLVVNNMSEPHDFYLTVMGDDYSTQGNTPEDEECDTLKEYTLEVSNVLTPTPIGEKGLCQLFNLRVHQVAYYVFDNQYVQNTGFVKVNILLDNFATSTSYPQPILGVGVAVTLNRLPLAADYKLTGFDSKISAIPDASFVDNVPSKGKYYIAVVVGLNGTDLPDVSQEKICQEAAYDYESLQNGVGITLSVDYSSEPMDNSHVFCTNKGWCNNKGRCDCPRDSVGSYCEKQCQVNDLKQVCSNHGQCYEAEDRGLCSCFQGFYGTTCSETTNDNSSSGFSKGAGIALAIICALLGILVIALAIALSQARKQQYDSKGQTLLSD